MCRNARGLVTSVETSRRFWRSQPDECREVHAHAIPLTTHYLIATFKNAAGLQSTTKAIGVGYTSLDELVSEVDVIDFSVVCADVEAVQADLLLLKYAQAHYGADEADAQPWDTLATGNAGSRRL